MPPEASDVRRIVFANIPSATGLFFGRPHTDECDVNTTLLSGDIMPRIDCCSWRRKALVGVHFHLTHKSKHELLEDLLDDVL